MIYVGLSRYTEESIEQLINLDAEGIVLGDLLCERKMFPNGGVEVLDIMRHLAYKNTSVIYQTPMYATDRIFFTILEKVSYYYEKNLIDAVIVQDIGLASSICSKCKGITVIWGRMGYARTPVINKETISFYMKHGVGAFECKNAEQAKYARMIGAVVYQVYGYPKYLTINRECYYRFEHNIFDAECGYGCLKHEKMLIPANQGIEVSVDGYVLGWENVYDNRNIDTASDFENHIIYAESISVAEEIIGRIATNNR